MESIMNWLQESVAFAVPMIVLLGLLIFVHELGHFLVAKYYKVRVEVFSLGFGPKLFKFKRGDTTYAISAVPLGGYVKMYGDDPTAEVPDDQKAVSFTHKPVGQRIAVVLAGPLMNFFFAVVIFMIVAFVGEPVATSKLGDITPETAAFQAGFRSGDVVTEVSGQAIATWEELQSAIESRAGKKTEFKVQRIGETQPLSLSATPELVQNKNPLSWESEVGEIAGISLSSRLSVVGISDASSPAFMAGIRSGDIVTSVGGETLDKWRELVPAIERSAAAGDSIKISVSRVTNAEDPDGERKTHEVTLSVPASAKGLSGEALVSSLGMEWPETYVGTFVKRSPAKKAGLKIGDKIVAIDGKPVKTFDEITAIIRGYSPEAPVHTGTESNPAQSHGEGDRPLQIELLREGKIERIAVVPQFKGRPTRDGREDKRYEIGFGPLIGSSPPATFQWSTSNPAVALQHGVSQTLRWTNLTVLGFVRLFTGHVSAKNIGGFITIGVMAKRSWQIGMSQFLNIMAMISINLFILNLLPVPVLDGGHLVFFSIEALRGAPLSMRKLEIAQQVGLILLLVLMVFALFNDVTRIFN